MSVNMVALSAQFSNAGTPIPLCKGYREQNDVAEQKEKEKGRRNEKSIEREGKRYKLERFYRPLRAGNEENVAQIQPSKFMQVFTSK